MVGTFEGLQPSSTIQLVISRMLLTVLTSQYKDWGCRLAFKCGFELVFSNHHRKRSLPRLLNGLRPPRLAFPVGFWESPVDMCASAFSTTSQRGAGVMGSYSLEHFFLRFRYWLKHILYKTINIYLIYLIYYLEIVATLS